MSYVRECILVAAMVLAMGGCASTSTGSNTALGDPQDEPPTMEVENRYFEDMVVYLLGGASRVRLGMVMRNTSATLAIPRELVGFGPVRLQAVPIGPGRGFTSERLLIPPGSKVDFRLAPNLAFSDYAVW